MSKYDKERKALGIKSTGASSISSNTKSKYAEERKAILENKPIEQPKLSNQSNLAMLNVVDKPVEDKKDSFNLLDFGKKLITPTPFIEGADKLINRTKEEQKADMEQFAKSKPGALAYGLTDSATLSLNKKLAPNLYDTAKQSNPVEYGIGEAAGYLAPGAGSVKLTKPIVNLATKKVGSELGKRIIEGAISGSLVDMAQGAIQGDNLSELENRIARGAIIGAVADSALFGLGKIGKVILNKIASSKALTNAEIKAVDSLPVEAKEEIYKAKPDVFKQVSYTVQKNPKGVTNWVQTEWGNIPVQTKTVGEPIIKTKVIHPIKKQTNTLESPLPKPTTNTDAKPASTETLQRIVDNPTLYPADMVARAKEKLNVGSNLTPKQQELIAEVDRELSTYKEYIQKSPMHPEDKAKRIKGRAMALAAKKREIIQGDSLIPIEGGLTAKELTSKIEYLKSNYVGKKVIADGVEGTVVKNSFGKVGVKHPDGTIKYYEQDKIIPETNIDDVISVQSNNVKTMNNSNKTQQTPRADVQPPTPKVDLPQPTPSKPIMVNPKPETGNIERGLNQTVKESSQFSDEVKQGVNGTYSRKANTDLIKEAEDLIKVDPEKALRMAKSDKIATDLSNEVAHQLIQKANLEGRFEDAIDLIEITAKKATESGRAVQALSMWARLSPEGMIKYAQRVVNNANQKFAKANPEEYKRIVEEFKKQGIDLQFFASRNDLKKVIRLTAEDAKYINDRMVKIQGLPDGREKTVAIAQTLDYIAGKIPPTLQQKISSIQAMAQLINPKTAIRNTVSNFGFGAVENLSNTLATGFDVLASGITKKRTTALPSLKTQTQGFAKGWKLGLEDALLGIDTSGIKTQFDLPNNKTFRNGILGKLEKVMNVELKATDRAFYQSAYDDAIRKQVQINKAKEPTADMEELAHFEALYRTFQDENILTEAFKTFKRGLNFKKEWGLGDILLKYPKTPANILMRGIEYSPIGISNAIFELARPLFGGVFNQSKFVNALSRGLVGSSLVGAGVMLYDKGIITGKRNKDKDVADLQKTVGTGGYKINVSALKRFVMSGFNPEEAKIKNGDKLLTYDWFQPLSIPTAVGANIGENNKTAKPMDVLGAVVNALEGGASTLAEQPLLSGLSNAFKGYDPVESFLQSILSAPASFVPTLLNQTKQLTDNTSRNVNDDSPVQKSLNLITNKIPGLSKKLPERVNTLGKTSEVFQNGSNNPFNVFINPAFSSTYNDSNGAKVPLDYYEKTGETRQFPTVAPKTLTFRGEKIELTKSEQNKMQRLMGESTAEKYRVLENDSNFKNLSDELKLKKMLAILEQSREKAKIQLLKDKGLVK